MLMLFILDSLPERVAMLSYFWVARQSGLCQQFSMCCFSIQINAVNVLWCRICRYTKVLRSQLLNAMTDHQLTSSLAWLVVQLARCGNPRDLVLIEWTAWI